MGRRQRIIKSLDSLFKLSREQALLATRALMTHCPQADPTVAENSSRAAEWLIHDGKLCERSPYARREALITYMLVKVQEADWHGVSDAANDLRVLEARYPESKS